MKQKAFTLIEVLIVVLILGTLTTIAIPMFQGAVMKAKFTKLLLEFDHLQRYADMYLAECGGWENVVWLDFSTPNYDKIAEVDNYRLVSGFSGLGEPSNTIFTITVYDNTQVGGYPPLCEKRLFQDNRIEWHIWSSFHPNAIYLKKLLASIGSGNIVEH